MSEDVERLVREERLLEAAEAASRAGDPATASRLFERACDWRRAANEALRAGDGARAMTLAAEARDFPLAERAVALLSASPASARSVAGALSARGHDRWAARLLEGCGEPDEAARAYERAGEAHDAARIHEATGHPVAAARVLEAAMRREPEAWRLAVALGALLARFGKPEAAARALQRVPAGAPERVEALSWLTPVLEALGLGRAAGEAREELAARGGVPANPSAPSRPAAAARVLGRYELVREVASSPSARVLECLDPVRGERVAIKVLAGWDARGSGRDALARFEREVLTLRALNSNGVVPLRDFVAEGPAIVLAWMAGGTLEALLASTGALAPARAAEIAGAVLAALAVAHGAGILHRDVKPANVLFDEAGAARLSDFGVAHLGDVSTTATAGVFGTLAYMSPEQRAGRPASPRSDVYAVGIVLREMLTGQSPAAGAGTLVSPSEAHGALDARHDALMARLTAADAGARPDDALAARAELLALPWPSTTDPTGVRPRASRRPSAAPAPDARLVVGAAGETDLWTGRTIERVPLDRASLARARAFARADHPALQTVVRVDVAGGAIWLEALTGPPLEALSPGEREGLRRGVQALHASGQAHGGVGPAALATRRGRPVLRFGAPARPDAAGDDDLRAVDAL